MFNKDMNEDVAVGLAIFLVFAGLGMLVALPIFALGILAWLT